MERDDRKKLTANELYLQECMSILYTKICANTYNFFGEDGKVKKSICFNIENYRHGTITCTYNDNALKICYDGTNFEPIFTCNKDGGFLYKLTPLGIEYLCADRKLDESIHECKIIRTVGKSADYYKYLCRDTFFVLLKHVSKDENGITIVADKTTQKYNDKKLIEYFESQYQKAYEMEAESLENVPVAEEFETMDDEETEEPYEVNFPLVSSFSKRDLEEIDAYASDDAESLYEIDYSLSEFLKGYEDSEPYSSNYPSRIEDFDYEKYVNNLDLLSDIEESSDRTGSIADNADIDIDLEDDAEEDVNSSGDLYSAMDTVLSEDGFINDEVFYVVRNGEFIEKQKKSDIVDSSVISVMDINQEVMTLKDYYSDALSEIKKMRAIIIKRKERIEKLNKKDNSDNNKSKGMSDKNIE